MNAGAVRWIGFIADSANFLGALLLALDAPRRLKDLRSQQTEERFEEVMADVPLIDREEQLARRAAQRGLAGIYLVTLGFLLQLIGRILG